MTANPRTIVVTLILISFVLLLAAPALTGRAQSSETPPAWGEFLNPDGSINWSNLTYAGEVSQPAEWMNIEVPGGIQVPLGEATYNRYITPSGNVLVLPSPATLFMTFLHPQESGFNQNPPEMLGSGAALMAMLAADYINPSDLQALGYVDTADFFQAVIDGQENIWSLVSPNFLMEIARMTIDSGYLVTALWLYLNGQCDAVPGGCPPELAGLPTPGGPGGSPTPQPASCPAPVVSYNDVTVSGAQVAPLKPVVVGQDPEKRGLDVEVSIHIPPVIFTWYEPKLRQTCRAASNGAGAGCPGPGSRYQAVIAANGQRISWNASMENSPEWQHGSELECVQHVEIFADYLDNAVVNANLSGESRRWITNDLAAAYPGASLKHPDWQFVFSGPGNLGRGQAVLWTTLIPGIQAADPGVYHLRAQGRTTGTPVSPPRPFEQAFGQFTVELLRVTLIEAP